MRRLTTSFPLLNDLRNVGADRGISIRQAVGSKRLSFAFAQASEGDRPADCIHLSDTVLPLVTDFPEKMIDGEKATSQSSGHRPRRPQRQRDPAHLHLTLAGRRFAQDIERAADHPVGPRPRISGSHGCECEGSRPAPGSCRTAVRLMSGRVGSADLVDPDRRRAKRHRHGPAPP